MITITFRKHPTEACTMISEILQFKEKSRKVPKRSRNGSRTVFAGLFGNPPIELETQSGCYADQGSDNSPRSHRTCVEHCWLLHVSISVRQCPRLVPKRETSNGLQTNLPTPIARTSFTILASAALPCRVTNRVIHHLHARLNLHHRAACHLRYISTHHPAILAPSPLRN